MVEHFCFLIEWPSTDEQVTNVSDTTAAEARRGKDIQGIPWSVLQFTREKYREQRLLQYKNYENLNRSHEELDKVSRRRHSGGFVVILVLHLAKFEKKIVCSDAKITVLAKNPSDFNQFAELGGTELLCFRNSVLKQECQQVKKGGKFYQFRHNTRSVKSTYVHFQVFTAKGLVE